MIGHDLPDLVISTHGIEAVRLQEDDRRGFPQLLEEGIGVHENLVAERIHVQDGNFTHLQLVGCGTHGLILTGARSDGPPPLKQV